MGAQNVCTFQKKISRVINILKIRKSKSSPWNVNRYFAFAWKKSESFIFLSSLKVSLLIYLTNHFKDYIFLVEMMCKKEYLIHYGSWKQHCFLNSFQEKLNISLIQFGKRLNAQVYVSQNQFISTLQLYLKKRCIFLEVFSKIKKISICIHLI